MCTFKEVLCLLAIIAGYGVAGRMDQDDAVLLEAAECVTTAASATADWQASTAPRAHDASKRCEPPAL